MYEQMSGEGGGSLEHFSTHRTAKRPLLKQQASWLLIQVLLMCKKLFPVRFVQSRNIIIPFKRNWMLTLPLHCDRSVTVLLDLVCAGERGALPP